METKSHLQAVNETLYQGTSTEFIKFNRYIGKGAGELLEYEGSV